MALIATSGASNANSYITQVEAAVYSPAQEAAIQLATLQLDLYLAWQGTRTYPTQALAWPRTGVFYHDTGMLIPPDTIPEWLKRATAEQAGANELNQGGD